MTSRDTARRVSQLVAAARAALDAHAALEATHDTEPCPHRDAVAWTRWHHETYLPADHAWQAAVDCLEGLIGDDFPGREGHGWFALCLRILTGEHDPTNPATRRPRV